VAALSERWHIKPQVHVDVVLLTALESLVFFAARAGHDEELVVEHTDGVSVSVVLQVVTRNAVELLSSVVDEFEATLQRGGLGAALVVDVTATDHEKTARRRLDVLEVVLEFSDHVHGAPKEGVCRHVELVQELGVSFEDVQGSDRTSTTSLLVVLER